MTVKRKATTQDSSFGVVAEYTVIAQDVPCFIQAAQGSAQTIYAQRKLVVDQTVYTEEDVPIANGDLIVNQADGAQYVVVGIRQPVGRRSINRYDCQYYIGGN